MQYFVKERERKASQSTCYLEFQKGRYNGQCWRYSSISIRDEIWDEHQMSQLVRTVVPDFDYCGLTVITKAQWEAIVENSRDEACPGRPVIEEAIPWVNRCFEKQEVFTICGL